MTTKLYLTISSIISILYALSFLLLPGSSLEIYGLTPEPHINATLQFFGAAIVPLAIVIWFAREFEAAATRKVLTVTIVANALYILLSVIDFARGLINAAVWASVAINILLIIAASYCLKNEPVSASEPQRRTV